MPLSMKRGLFTIAIALAMTLIPLTLHRNVGFKLCIAAVTEPQPAPNQSAKMVPEAVTA
jgi:hypothetical protein